MTTETGTDWGKVAGQEDEERAGWITEHSAVEDQDGRRDWMRAFIGGTLEQDEDGRTRMMKGLLMSFLDKEDAEAKSYASDFQWVLDHGRGDVAFASVQSLHTGARDLPVDDTMRLGSVWPRIFGKDIAATV
jgi:hypothetical protein